MRSVKAKVHIASWNGSVGAKGELQQAWFRVKGVPYNKRSIQTLAYVGSLVGVTTEVDKTTLNRADFVRVNIAVKGSRICRGGNIALSVWLLLWKGGSARGKEGS
jgi:hypothetical protein